jgi:pyridinium-3,5-bisthiocarboxylic acid mononucleotide nickel chelatase
MTVAALIDAGADAQALIQGLDSLGTGARFRTERVKMKGIMSTRFTVEHEDQKKHRHLPHIVRMIEAAELPERTKRNAIRVFEVLGEAEAAVHGTSIEKVHFHEVGAVDSICDIVGACLGLDLLGIDAVYCSAINTGSGTVEADHGVMPVPAPATALLLKGKPVFAKGPETELATPTGAALMAALSQGFGPMPAMIIETMGFGAGTKEFATHANVVRLLIGHSTKASETVTLSVIEANVDDSTPEVVGYAMERLLAEGALDITLQPIYMKKQRPGVLVQVIARPEDRERLCGVLMRETSTLGVRWSQAERMVAERSLIEVETGHGRVRVKVANGTPAPEFDDCRALAVETGLPLKQIMAAALAAYQKDRS